MLPFSGDFSPPPSLQDLADFAHFAVATALQVPGNVADVVLGCPQPKPSSHRHTAPPRPHTAEPQLPVREMAPVAVVKPLLNDDLSKISEDIKTAANHLHRERWQIPLTLAAFVAALFISTAGLTLITLGAIGTPFFAVGTVPIAIGSALLLGSIACFVAAFCLCPKHGIENEEMHQLWTYKLTPEQQKKIYENFTEEERALVTRYFPCAKAAAETNRQIWISAQEKN